MKGKLLILFVLLTAQQAYAQIGAGNTLIGGSLQFQNSEMANRQEIRVLPNAQFFMNDKISLGGSVGLITSRNNLGQDAFTRTNTVVISPEARYYIGLSDNVHFYGAANLGIAFGGSTSINGNDRTDNNDVFNFNFGIMPGILFTPGSKIGFNFELNLISFSRNSSTPAGTNTTTVLNGFTFGTNTFVPTFGLYYILGN